MSKFEDSIFNVGDKVMLSPESQWVGSNSDQPDSANPTGVVGEITKEHVDARKDDTPFHWRVTWTNNTCNSYHSEDLILVEEKIVVTSPEDDLHQLIEELQCHVETLEQALEMVTKELIELREEQSVSTETPFKPICDMTMEDWEQAKDEGWVFADNKFSGPNMVESITGTDIYFDYFTYPFDIKGVHTEEPEEYQIIKRIK